MESCVAPSRVVFGCFFLWVVGVFECASLCGPNSVSRLRLVLRSSSTALPVSLLCIICLPFSRLRYQAQFYHLGLWSPFLRFFYFFSRRRRPQGTHQPRQLYQ